MTLQSQVRGDKTDMRQCRRCGVAKLLLLDFGVGRPNKAGQRQPDSYCRKCRVDLNTKRRKAQRSTPEGLVAWRATKANQMRNWRERNRERSREICRASYQRMKADPVRYARYLEANRLAMALRRERQGLPPRGTRPTRPSVVPPDPTFRLKLPVDPFVEWLTTEFPNPLDAAMDASMKRRVFAYLHGESAHVAITAADAMLTANGFHLRDVWTPDQYPWLYEGAT